jgi:hypothetical protein
VNDPTYSEATVQAYAKMVANFYKALRAENLTRIEALTLTAAWIVGTIAIAGSKK